MMQNFSSSKTTPFKPACTALFLGGALLMLSGCVVEPYPGEAVVAPAPEAVVAPAPVIVGAPCCYAYPQYPPYYGYGYGRAYYGGGWRGGGGWHGGGGWR